MPDVNDCTAGRDRDVPLKDLMTTAEVAEVTGHTVKTLNQYRSWRTTGLYPEAGPEFMKLGRSVFYTRQAVGAYLDRRA
jgi:hypothetical protein